MQKRMKALGLAVALAVVTAGCEEEEPPEGVPAGAGGVSARPLDPALAQHLPEGVSFELAEEGQALYPVCGVCHGMEGEGTQLGPSFRDPEWIHGSGEIQEIAEITRTGVADPEEFSIPMPVLGGGRFDARQVQAVATYVYLLSRDGQTPE